MSAGTQETRLRSNNSGADQECLVKGIHGVSPTVLPEGDLTQAQIGFERIDIELNSRRERAAGGKRPPTAC